VVVGHEDEVDVPLGCLRGREEEDPHAHATSSETQGQRWQIDQLSFEVRIEAHPVLEADEGGEEVAVNLPLHSPAGGLHLTSLALPVEGVATAAELLPAFGAGPTGIVSHWAARPKDTQPLAI
jgi:hypothetical protein